MKREAKSKGEQRNCRPGAFRFSGMLWRKSLAPDAASDADLHPTGSPLSQLIYSGVRPMAWMISSFAWV